MNQANFYVSLSPKDAYKMVMEKEDADLIHEELHELGNEKYMGILIFEKYYMRVGNRAALIVMIDNLKGQTEVRTVSTGSSPGMIFSFDWGASDDFVDSVKDILKKYII
ncbi:DUF6054 family protein [Crassaminicella profunda]|uniref:DUF6054 family protein n=1 Tax=Crassaminicella profunda TaxID=1286698 RepID=UPI001CA72876|nr:DUF6054 family protein [Crassaminicella profunda]QZY53919.1 DUF6054 family protein [Crassaminicella profunda]